MRMKPMCAVERKRRRASSHKVRGSSNLAQRVPVERNR
jgi:hypothetical protein